MFETIEQRPTRREVLPYNGIRANAPPLCPEFWSPEQIAHTLRVQYPDMAAWHLVHESI